MSRPKQSKGSTDLAKRDLVTKVTGLSDSTIHGACSPGRKMALRSRSGNSGSANSQSLPALLHLALQHISQPNHETPSVASSSIKQEMESTSDLPCRFPTIAAHTALSARQTPCLAARVGATSPCRGTHVESLD